MSKPRSTSISWPSTSMDRKSKPGCAPASSSMLSSVLTGTWMTASRRRARRHARAVEPRQRAGHVQRQRAPGILRRRAGDREHLGGAVGAQLAGKLGLRLDQHAGPAGLLQMPGLRARVRIVGADLDEIASGVAEEGGDQPRLMVGLWSEASATRSPSQRDLGARLRSTMALVEWPGTSSIRITWPPSASTMSRPTTWSGL